MMFSRSKDFAFTPYMISNVPLVVRICRLSKRPAMFGVQTGDYDLKIEELSFDAIRWVPAWSKPLLPSHRLGFARHVLLPCPDASVAKPDDA